MKKILVDARWKGTHGIGRFTHEISSRLKNSDNLTAGPSPLSLKNLVWQPYMLRRNKNRYDVFFNPGFHPVLFSPIPYVLTIHDLIHLQTHGISGFKNKFFYEAFIKPSIKKAKKIITVSEYSKNKIMEWANVPSENIVVAYNGISSMFTKEGKKHTPGYSYLLHVGNTKPHKNIVRLLQAFAISRIDKTIKLILTGKLTDELKNVITENDLKDRIIFCDTLSDEKLSEYYRGALGFVFPSLYEGFGIPVLEAMSCGVPTLVSNVTSLPEISGDAALFTDPYSVDSIAQGIEKIIHDGSLRKELIEKGLERVKLFSWDKTATFIQNCLE